LNTGRQLHPQERYLDEEHPYRLSSASTCQNTCDSWLGLVWLSSYFSPGWQVVSVVDRAVEGTGDVVVYEIYMGQKSKSEFQIGDVQHLNLAANISIVQMQHINLNLILITLDKIREY
jgi:hypothetical protein